MIDTTFEQIIVLILTVSGILIANTTIVIVLMKDKYLEEKERKDV